MKQTQFVVVDCVVSAPTTVEKQPLQVALILEQLGKLKLLETMPIFIKLL